MDIKAVQSSYTRWAPVYDRTFGVITSVGRRQAVSYINKRSGRVLEVGVGTGLSLRHYRAHLQVTGIDYSEEMLAKAREKMRGMRLPHVAELRRMDARALDFPDNHFDTIAAMHVLSVVPEPERVMTEIARVCKPGGRVVITNHFAHSEGIFALLSRAFAPFSNTLGWHSDFEVETVLREKHLTEVERARLPPLGMMTMLVLEKTAAH